MEQAEKKFHNKWLILISVGTGIFLATIDGSIVNLTLPVLSAELNTDFAMVEWVVISYLLTVTTLMLTVGRLADMKGKKPIYMAGFLIFTLGSLFCGLASNIYLLIAARIFQALGAAMTMALGMAIITESFPPSERGMALGLSGTLVSLGTVLGPTLGGLILKYFTWHWVFFVNLPLGVIGVLMVQRFVPFIRPKGQQRFDFAGAVTFLGSILSFLLALTTGQRQGFTSQPVLWLAAAFVVLLGAFIWVEMRVPQPMVELRLFRNRLFSVNLATGFLSFLCSSGMFILMPFYLSGVRQFDPQQTGLLLSAIPLCLGVVAPLAGTLSDRFGTRPMTVIGLTIAVGGYFIASTLNQNTGIWSLFILFIPIGLGLGIFQSPNNSAIMGTAPHERLGIVSGMLAMTRTLGQTAGVAIWGAFWAARTFGYTGQVLEGGASMAPGFAQVLGLQDTLRTMAFIVLAALLLAIWALLEERVFKTTTAINPTSYPNQSSHEGE